MKIHLLKFIRKEANGIYTTHWKKKKKNPNLIKKWIKEWNRHSSKEDIQIANRYFIKDVQHH